MHTVMKHNNITISSNI